MEVLLSWLLIDFADRDIVVVPYHVFQSSFGPGSIFEEVELLDQVYVLFYLFFEAAFKDLLFQQCFQHVDLPLCGD